MYKAFLVAAVYTGCAFGQTVTAAGPSLTIRMGDMAEFGPIGITTALAGPMTTVVGAPYSAQAATQRVQILTDGNRIEQTTTSSVARDSQGRMRRDESLPGLTLNNGEAPQIVMIDDPVAGVHWTLDAQRKTAMKMTIPAGKAGAFGYARAMPVPAMPPAASFSMSDGEMGGIVSAGGKGQMFSQTFSKSGAEADVSKTDLGMQTIEGVTAQGTRMTRTIPAGEVGNQLPIVITTETWYSPALKVLVMSKSSDPRMGETTYTLTNIDRSEPAASLFQVPADYTVRDQPGPVFQKFKNTQ